MKIVIVVFALLTVTALMLSCCIPVPVPSHDGGGHRGGGHRGGGGGDYRDGGGGGHRDGGDRH